MAYQPHAFGGDGIAAVAYGDPDTADHTAVYVPGIMQDGTQIDENGGQALNLYEETDQPDGRRGPAPRGLGVDHRLDRLRLPQLQPRVDDAVGPRSTPAATSPTP